MSTETRNPLDAMIDDAMQIRNYLGDSITALEVAIEADANARRLSKQLAEEYANAETEYLLDAAIDGKNAEQRKLQTDAAIAKARQNGLGQPWRNANAAKYAAEDAAMTLEQTSKRFSATRTAAELTAAILIAATKGAVS